VGANLRACCFLRSERWHDPARWYGISAWGCAGCSDAKIMDEQAALEAMLSVLMVGFSGANLIHTRI
jgi:trimethylamine:corrinoid methyltransferase-like protein